MKRKAGVYLIENIVTSQIYIGESVSLRERELSHFSCLARGKHGNKKLQESFDRYGRAAFVWKVIEYSPIEEPGTWDGSEEWIYKLRIATRDTIKWLHEKEEFYIKTLSPFFNIAPAPRFYGGGWDWIERDK